MAFDVKWTARRLEARRAELAGQLPLLAEFTPGSVSETWSKCGKATCHCARDGDPGHGPRWLWVRYEAGKTRTRTVPERLVAEMKDGVARAKAFSEKTAEIAAINAVLAERSLLKPGQAPSRSREQAS
jgi:hypothetical protein